jgi:hypothetical protein
VIVASTFSRCHCSGPRPWVQPQRRRGSRLIPRAAQASAVMTQTRWRAEVVGESIRLLPAGRGSAGPGTGQQSRTRGQHVAAPPSRSNSPMLPSTSAITSASLSRGGTPYAKAAKLLGEPNLLTAKAVELETSATAMVFRKDAPSLPSSHEKARHRAGWERLQSESYRENDDPIHGLTNPSGKTLRPNRE